MSLAYYISLDNKEPGFDTFVNGKAVAHAAEKLDEICAISGLPPLDSFLGQSSDELAEMLGDDFDENEDGFSKDEAASSEKEGFDEEWFEAEKGISFIDALIAAISQHPAILPEPTGIIDDLNEYKTVLQQTQAIHAKWHLAIDF